MLLKSENAGKLFDLDCVLDKHSEVLSSFIGLPIENVRFDSEEDYMLAAFDIVQDDTLYTFIFSREYFGKVYKYFSDNQLGIQLAAAVLGKK